MGEETNRTSQSVEPLAVDGPTPHFSSKPSADAIQHHGAHNCAASIVLGQLASKPVLDLLALWGHERRPQHQQGR
jgi:hypothetical protein